MKATWLSAGLAAGCGMKDVGGRNGVGDLERANLVVGVALIVQPVEHHLFLLGGEGADAGQLAAWSSISGVILGSSGAVAAGLAAAD